MNNELKFDVDPPDRYAPLRRTVWLTLLAAIVALIALQAGFFNPLLYPPNPKLVQQRLGQAFPIKSRTVLNNATQITLYSLYGSLPNNGASGEFHGYQILSQRVLTGAERQRVVAALYDGLADGGHSSMCFCPHHGVRAVRGKQIVDFVICFDCGNVEIHAADAKGGGHIGRQPEKYFNSLLRESGATFDPKYKP